MAECQSTVTYRDVPGYPGYRVGDDGSVWTCWRGKYPPYQSDQWRRLKCGTNHNGYLRVGLYSNGRQCGMFVHRMVLEAFVGPCPEGMEGCHYPDRDPANNTLGNLRWDTKKANAADRIHHGTHFEGEQHSNSKLTAEQVLSIRIRAASGEKQRALAAEYGVTQAAISLIVTRQKWRSVK